MTRESLLPAGVSEALFEQEIVLKAVILKETRKIVVGEVPDAEMRETTDVLPRLTSTAICGTDLHFYEGRMSGLKGSVIGHEPLGVVQLAEAARRARDAWE